MASLADAEEVLRSTSAKANFQRLTRLLMCGGLRLLRETFDSIHSPADLPLRLSDAAIKTQLRGARLTKPEWDCLYPSAGVYGKSTDFDITLTFRLLRTICNLTPPPGPRGWDVLPKSSDHSLEADLVRIKYYRNEVYGHSKTMEITDTEFNDLWGKISEVLMRIAARRSPEKKDEWKKSIDGFLRNALTPGEERYIEELNTWYKQDMDVKSEVEKLKEEFKIQMGDLKEEVAKQSQRPVTVIVNVVVNIAESIKRTGSSGRPQIPHESGESQGICAIPVLDQEEMEGTSDSGKQLATPTEIRIWTVILSFKRSVELVFQYLRYTLKAFVCKHDVGSLLITVECSSLQILEGLWEDYSSGHLNAIAQEILVTAEVLEKLGLDDVRLKTFISEEEYQKGKQIFMDHSVSGQSRLPPGEVAGKSASLVEAEKDTVSEFVPGDVPGERITPIEEGKDIGDDSGQDYLKRISNLEKENRELTRRLNAVENELQGISNLKKENRELTRRLNAVEKKLQGKESGKIQQLEKKNIQLEKRLDASEIARERSFVELQYLKNVVSDLEEHFSDMGFRFPTYPSRRLSLRPDPMLDRVSGLPLEGIKGFCQVVVNRQKLEALDGEKVEFERVFKDLGFDVDEKVCKSNDDVKRVIVSVADRDYSDYNRFVCFIQSNVNRDWEIEGFDGGSLSVAKLLTNFRYSRFSSWSEPLKIFIIQGHQTTTALEADEPIDEKSFSLKLPFGENCLCLFVPYRKGYISTLLSVIKSQGSKPRDIFDILSEAKKLFYEKNHITIPDPVHNFRGPVYLNQEI